MDQVTEQQTETKHNTISTAKEKADAESEITFSITPERTTVKELPGDLIRERIIYEDNEGKSTRSQTTTVDDSMERQGRAVSGNEDNKAQEPEERSERVEKGEHDKPAKGSEKTEGDRQPIVDPESLHNTNTDPINEEKSEGTNTTGLSDEIKAHLHPMHEEWKHGMEIDHENRLAKEIRKVYCELSSVRRIQTMTMAQSNGIPAAAMLRLPTCSSLQGMGQALTLQECAKKEATVTAIETSCGFQPFTIYNSGNSTNHSATG